MILMFVINRMQWENISNLKSYTMFQTKSHQVRNQTGIADLYGVSRYKNYTFFSKYIDYIDWDLSFNWSPWLIKDTIWLNRTIMWRNR